MKKRISEANSRHKNSNEGELGAVLTDDDDGHGGGEPCNCRVQR